MDPEKARESRTRRGRGGEGGLACLLRRLALPHLALLRGVRLPLLAQLLAHLREAQARVLGVQARAAVREEKLQRALVVEASCSERSQRNEEQGQI